MLRLIVPALVILLSSSAIAAPRDVQIVSVDFEFQTIELVNFGPTAEDLSGWRFCSHDDTFIRRYSSSTGLNGVSIAAGEALTIHLNNDSGGAPGTIDRPSGAFALPFDEAAHGLQLYFAPVSFGNGNTIADHLQWSIGGLDDSTADERSDEAELGGVWTDQSEWISTTPDSLEILQLEESDGAILHSPVDYEVVPEPGTSAMLVAGMIGLLAMRPRNA